MVESSTRRLSKGRAYQGRVTGAAPDLARRRCERSARRMESRLLGADRQGSNLMKENLPDQCAAAPSRLCAKQNRSAIVDAERRVRFQEPDIIEVVSWKDATHLMQYKGKKKLEEEEFMLGALSSLPHRFALMAALMPMVVRFAIGIVDTVM
ncbi:hypothetical protein AK812_SmicGene21726 [Symbiodinium microadriaticum]|uniref:Uncharacterized protein n=1 Tax=Symbiodinium microadriaticum TaxID=2951 RepID=A0A1Q9DLN3_SYMMI|nr:hypothetical protein AK812_SmicGene21726 [Symbiodinium microadriaticum]CAE7941182.1 unnamed protein product [Symbiodinium sp. KB8]